VSGALSLDFVGTLEHSGREAGLKRFGISSGGPSPVKAACRTSAGPSAVTFARILGFWFDGAIERRLG
jgi:hypothetical protein